MSTADEQHRQTPEINTMVDPYVVGTLQQGQGSNMVIQTTEGSVVGRISEVYPDHIIVMKNETPKYVRIQQIIWAMPLDR
ncbi:DUF2642 domain-containing protein [Salsuginibacillus kocurii]|uniref:DUF2642 domain-containing protein n=1 Tax=Salsuginibacillus kocurii TaxID=427078 RepID=UPI00037C05A9|nr:DUF2642 domain-containing protein [Salsuginibacillus kocurii]